MLLETKRLILRRFRPADAPVLAAYRSDPQVARYQSWDAPFPLLRAQTAVANFIASDPDKPGWFQYAAERTEDRALIGDVAVHLHDNLRQAEIGFTLAPAYQGKGLATEAVTAVLDRLVGDVAVHLHDNLMQAEVGFTLARAYQGKGLATEAVSAVLDRLFGVQGLHKVAGECDARNTASARLLERLGFVREGHLREQTYLKGEWTDDLVYGLLAPEWLGR